MSDAEENSRAGTHFGPYRLVRLLGRGGMGEVYEAEDTVRERTVALKLMSASVSKDSVFRKRMEREARTAGRLQEPHVVPIHDFGEIDGQLFVDMRMIEGTDLGSVLSRFGPMAAPRAVAIVRQIASALDAAHTAGVMHRDIKPANILLTSADFAYLVDFGIASATTDEKLTSMGATIGTWRYMAPERFTNRDVSYSVDTYALACVLFEALTGSPPYRGVGPSVMTAHLTQPIPRPSSVRSTIPPALDDVIARGMAKTPADRYVTTGDFAQAALEVLSERDQDHAENILNRSQLATLPKMPGSMKPVPPTRRASSPPTRRDSSPPTRRDSSPPTRRTPPPSYRTPTPPSYRTPAPPSFPTPAPRSYPTPTPPSHPTPTPPPSYPTPTPTPPPYSSGAPPSGPVRGPSQTPQPQPFSSGPWGQVPAQVPPRRTNTWLLVGIGAAVVLAVVVGLVIWLVFASPPSPPANAVKLQVLDDSVSVGSDEAPKTIDVFNEPICPPCGQFIRSYSAQMYTAITDKKIKVHYHLLNFLDSRSASSDYSTRALAAALCVASADDPKLYTDFYAGLFASDFQPKENASTDPDDDRLAQLAQSVGSPGSVTDCIKSGQDLGAAKTKATNANNTLQGLLSNISTPSVFDGKDKIDISDSQWLNHLT
ncbi:MAG: protein kinase [Mycobacteriaceae bacterium]|nr:protein kinase [Mycobacteriaceae bacterium]